MTKADWTPILSKDGKHYCSPRCGGGKFCLREDYDHAVKAADELAARLGDGWKPRVWENLGWYYSVSKGCVTIRVTEGNGRPTTYSAWFEPDIVISHTKLQVIAYGSTPEDALGFATQDARTTIVRMEQALADLNGAVS